MSKTPAERSDRRSAVAGPERRSQLWFDDPHDPGMTALYLERYLNYGLTREELQSVIKQHGEPRHSH